MPHTIGFIQDLAVIMLIAGIVTVIFHRFKQPVVLGYIVTGVIIGPYTPPFELIHDEATISTLGELGVIFLMFWLGLEFSLRKLARVGTTAIVAALAEIILMLWLGYEIGRSFGWKTMDALFLGAMLAISSTTIIVKALDELGLKRERFAQVVFGILIVEDILAIVMIALLSGVASSGAVETTHAFTTLARLLLFMTVSLIIGLMTVPRLLHTVARFRRDEILLVTILGVCFGFCLLVVKLGYSIALGAFLIGAIMAESRARHAIERLMVSLRDMFSAIFFIAIGLMLDWHVLVDYAGPIAIITAVVVFGKILSCGLGAFTAGQDGRTSMRIGMSLAQIGEFSFIIASLGQSLRVTSGFLYPIAVAVSALTTFFTPYLIRAADPLTRRIATALSPALVSLFSSYTQWLSSLQPSGDRAAVLKLIRNILTQIAINLAFVAAIFVSVTYFAKYAHSWLITWTLRPPVRSVLLWSAALAISLPFLVAVYRKLKSLALLLAEISVQPAATGKFTASIRRALAELVPATAMIGIFLMVAALSSGILPPVELLIIALSCAALLLLVLWRWFVRIHAKLQIALREIFERPPET